MTQQAPARFTLLDWLYADTAADELFSLPATVAAWTRVETALAQARHDCGLIPLETMHAIRQLQPPSVVDGSFRQRSRVVGYPIITLVELLNEQLPPEHRGVIHLGATTQDIMDSALVLQIRAVVNVIDQHLVKLGDRLAELVISHASTQMPGRTHAQMAVPTTFGLKLSVFLDQVSRHLIELRNSTAEASVLSLHGAAGTSAALGTQAKAIRERCAELLELSAEEIPWHVARDRLVRVALCCASLSATLVRLGRETVDLSRTEIAEVQEAWESSRGASSTMPQKRNPILSEALIGLGVSAQASAQLMLRAAEAGHERAAGEWQIEWRALPDCLTSTASAAAVASDLLAGLQVSPDRMRQNLRLDHDLVYAESVMVKLAAHLGRERAHDLVYEAAVRSRAQDMSLYEAVAGVLAANGLELDLGDLAQDDEIAGISDNCQLTAARWESAKGSRHAGTSY